MSFISNSEARCCLQPCISLFAPVMNKSSTYNTRMSGILANHNVVQVRIRITLLETQLLQVSIYPRIPSSCSLLQDVECLLQPAYMGLPPMHLKALWFLNVHLLLYNVIQKCGFDIHPMDSPTHLCCNRYNGSTRSISSYGSKGLIIINSFYL